MEWLVLVGAEAVGFAFKKVLADLAVGTLEDYVKGFFTDSIQDLVGLAQKDKKSLKAACGKALKEFLALVQQELEDADLDESQLKRYEKSLKKLIRDDSVKAALGKPFQMALSDDRKKKASFTPEIFAQRWGELQLEPLPSSLDWGRVAKRYQKKVEHMVRASEELRPILDSRNLEKMRQIMEQSAPIAPDWDLSHYQAGLLDAYDKLDLEGLDSSRSYYPLQLWDMFVPQTVQERGNGAMSGSVLELLNGRENYRYAVILGLPGSGKSTLARYKALQWARQDAQYLTSQELPLLIELRNYIENRPKEKKLDFLEYLQNGTGVKGGNLNQRDLHHCLTASPSLVIFDGLDEVLDDGDRENVAIDIVNFSNRYPQARVLITSRLSGYEQQSQKLRAAEFREFELQDLDSEQIKDFIRRWHDKAFENKADGWEKRDRLQRSIDKSPAFRELAGNPLLLTMMAILNRNQELPDDRITLYQESSKVLLQLWDAKKHLPADSKLSDNLEYQDKQEILRQVAYRMQLDARTVGNNNLAIERSALQGTMTEAMKNLGIHDSRSVALSLRQQLETRSFILCFLGGDNYGFVHRSFQEFFCAWYLVYRYERKQNLTLEELKRDIFGRHWQDTAWHEVLSLVACWIDPRFSREILEDLLAVDGKDDGFANLFLAVKCLQDMRKIGQLQSAIAPLEQKLNSVVGGQAPVTPTVRDRALESLESLAKLQTP